MSTGAIDKKYFAGLRSGELLLKLTWDEWLSMSAPFENVDLPQRKKSIPVAPSFVSTAARAAKRSWISPPTADQVWQEFWLPRASKLSLSLIQATILPEAFGNSPFRSACRSISWAANYRSKRSKIEI